MIKHHYLLVRGIMWMPGIARDWTERMATWINLNTVRGCADNFQYLSTPATRAIFDSARARRFASMLHEYCDATEDLPTSRPMITIAAHSNGADVVLDGLEACGWPAIDALHLFAPAVDVKRILAAKNVGEIHVYLGGKDWALALAESVAGRALGFDSPTIAEEVEAMRRDPRVTLNVKESFGHDTWFNSENLPAYARIITMHDDLIAKGLIRAA